MTGVERREKLLSMLAKSKEPIAGAEMAKRLSVSRQVIVQDIALLKSKEPALTIILFQQTGDMCY